jgi:WS/DGAT/MGAT family acyltransferase
MLKQLTEQDAMFLHLETAETPTHVGGLSLVTLPDGYRGNFFEDYKATIASRMALIPFLHERLAPPPLGIDRPFWVEDEDFDLEYHVRHLTAPAPGRFSDLEALVALLHAHPLDRSRPLWEFYVIDGLASGQLAVYTKLHHAAMDGLSSQALVTTMYDPTPEGRTLARPASAPRRRRGAVQLVRDLLVHRARQVRRATSAVPELARACLRLVHPAAGTLRFPPIHRVPLAPRTLLNVGITNQRLYAARTLPLSAVKQLARRTGTKVNDVILAISSGALRGYLEDKQALPRRSLTAMVPVSAPAAADHSSANQNSLMLCSLATNLADPYERLLAIHRSCALQKQNFELYKHIPLPDLALPGSGAIVRALVERYGHSWLVGRPPLLGNLVISNEPGPPVPQYIDGAQITSMYPCSIPFHSQAVNITVESYCDRLDFGLIACRRAVPDLAQLADRLPTQLAELQRAVQRSCPAAPPPGPIAEDRTAELAPASASDPPVWTGKEGRPWNPSVTS